MKRKTKIKILVKQYIKAVCNSMVEKSYFYKEKLKKLDNKIFEVDNA